MWDRVMIVSFLCQWGAGERLPFSWRKKWEKCWEDVRKCSERCRRKKEMHQ
ncbi:DUF2256 domain-containing protein [Serratia sp. N21D137]|uniref:DUF2256 domain-containing protein n=1 Tax=Serratia sp. N21D137 TaxID=3397495 RepID=UPI0039E05E5C